MAKENTLGVLELNDSGLKLLQGSQVLLDSPGFALVSDKQLLVGKPARLQAKLHPLQSQNKFWQRMDTEAITSQNPKCRHHADLIFEHLQTIKNTHKHIENLVLALPAHYSQTQLSLLMGIGQHCQLNIIGLVDTAVASLSSRAVVGRHYFIDLHLHQALISQVDVDGEVRNSRIEAVPEAGLNACQDLCVRLIAEQFIQQTRFNPLHKAETEQELYNQLETTLQACQQQGESTLELAGYKAKITLQMLEDNTHALISKINRKMGNYSGQLFITERCNNLPGFAKAFPQAIVLSSEQLSDNIHQHSQAIVGSADGLQLVASLPANKQIPEPRQQAAATHLLWQHQAHPVNQTLHINKTQNKPLSELHDPSSICAIKRFPGGLKICDIQADTTMVNGKSATEGQSLISGDQIEVASLPHPFTVISVVGKHGA